MRIIIDTDDSDPPFMLIVIPAERRAHPTPPPRALTVAGQPRKSVTTTAELLKSA